MDLDRTRVYLARHGEVVNPGVYNGHTDVDITETGIRQMERLRDRLKEKTLAAVYSSDLLRTKKGAQIIAQPHGLRPESFREFREMDFGRWQGIELCRSHGAISFGHPAVDEGPGKFPHPGG